MAPEAFPSSHTAGFDALAAMGSELRQWFESHGVMMEPPPGILLIEEGVQEESVYIVLGGTARVVTSGRDGSSVELARLHRGTLTGEMSFLDPSLPVASVVAAEDCRVLEVDRHRLQTAIEGSPLLARQLYRLCAEKLSEQLREQNAFIHRIPGSEVEPLRKVLVVFAELSEADVAWLARTGRVLHLEPGDRLISQGDPVPDLYVILQGNLRVVLAAAGEERVVGTSRRGEILGEMSLLAEQGLATAGVDAAEPVAVLAVDKALLQRRISDDDAFASRFFRALALLLTQRSRDQLRGHGLARQAALAEGAMGPDQGLDDDSLDLETMSRITTAGHRFDWLCSSLQSA
jgi:bacteriocin-type transport-associated protein